MIKLTNINYQNLLTICLNISKIKILHQEKKREYEK